MTASRARPALEALRRRIEKIEKSKGGAPTSRPADACSLGPLRITPGAVHEIRIGEWRDAPAAHGLALAIAGKFGAETGKQMIWICEWRPSQSTGRSYGCGLIPFGVDPAKVVIVYPRNVEEALWATEEAVSVFGVGVVFAEFLKPHWRLDLTATRRLQLAAENSGATPILLRSSGDEEPSAARVRWRVGSAPSAADIYDLNASGNSRWRVELEKCRDGGRGVWVLEWDNETGELREAALHGCPLPAMGERSLKKTAAVA